ncbi:MAG: DNA primase [bacterium]
MRDAAGKSTGIIPQRKIDEVREATDILELVSGYVTLKKKGQNHFGLCPFHNEKTPSFSVNTDKQIFHCFGCGAGGNAFTFLMRYEGTSFPDVVKFLAQRAGIELEFELRQTDEGTSKQNEALYHINEFAAKWFQHALFGPAGEAALTYLRGRGLTDDNIKTLGLGYALPGWDNLIREAHKTSNDVETLLKAGLVLENEAGRRYDRFRDRVMFPIWNLSGRVVAFGGRVLRQADDSPKYINSPETSVYEKGKILYGLYQSRDEIRQQRKAIFVEGYMDLLSLAANGVRNVVATSGTALTQDQARLIRRYTRTIVLMYDSDSAGSAAALRGADVLIENGLEVHVVSLPAGHDPDSFVRDNGTQALVEQVEQAAPLFDHKLELVVAQAPEKRTESIRSWLESLARIKDMIQRSVLLTKAAQRLQMSEKILWAELETLSRRRVQSAARRSEIGERVQDLSHASKTKKSEKAIEDLIRILVHDWSLAEFIFDHLDLDQVAESSKLAILTYFKNQFKGGRQPTEADLLHQFHDVDLSQFVVSVLNAGLADRDARRLAEDCVNALQRERLQHEIDTVRQQLKAADGDAERIEDLLQQCMALERKKASLDRKR